MSEMSNTEAVHSSGKTGDSYTRVEDADDSLRRYFSKVPLIGELSYVPQGDVPAQEFIPVRYPIRGEPAIKRMDGGYIGLIEVEPTNMSIATEETWASQVRRLTSKLVGEVTYRCQWFDLMTEVDYSQRKNTYVRHAERIRRDADEGDVYAQTLADLYEERAGAISLHEQTTHSRSHFIVIQVTEDDITGGMSGDRGSFFGGSGDGKPSDAAMLKALRRRLNSMAGAIGVLDGVNAYTLGSVEASRVLADYYTGGETWNVAGWATKVRGAPSPAGDDSLDGVDYSRYDDEGAELGIVGSDDERSERYRLQLAPNDALNMFTDWSVSIDERRHYAIVAVTDFPQHPRYGLFSEILADRGAGITVDMSTHMTRMTNRSQVKRTTNDLRQKAMSAMSDGWWFADKYKRDYFASADVDAAMDDPADAVFDASVYFRVGAPTLEDLWDAVSNIKSDLIDINATGALIHKNPLAGWLSAAPVCKDMLGQTGRGRAEGLARIFPWASFNLQEPGGIEFGTHATRQEPTVVDIMNRDTSFNIGIFGNLGSGKTITNKRIVSLFRAIQEDAQIVVMDPVQEFAGLCYLFGGKRIVIGGDTSINPMHIEPTPEDKLDVIGRETPYRDWQRQVETFIQTYYGLEQGLDFSGKKSMWLRAARLAAENVGIEQDPETHDPDHPDRTGMVTLTDVIDIIEQMASNPGDYVSEALDDVEQAKDALQSTALDIIQKDVEAFRPGGKYEHLTGETTIDFDDSDFVYLDLQRYEGEERAGLMMQLLVSQVYEQTKTSDYPTLLSVDESHTMFRHTDNREFFKKKLRHGRHFDLSMIFATQTVSEFFTDHSDDEGTATTTAEVILDNMSIMMFHYLQEISRYGERMDLTDREIDFVSQLEPGSEERGFSEAMLRVHQLGTFPLQVRMERGRRGLNPREFNVYLYDPTKHGEDFEAYLRECDDECRWSWMAHERQTRLDESETDDPEASVRGDDELPPTPGGRTRGDF